MPLEKGCSGCNQECKRAQFGIHDPCQSGMAAALGGAPQEVRPVKEATRGGRRTHPTEAEEGTPLDHERQAEHNIILPDLDFFISAITHHT
jgi:hypothetical protein